MKKPLIYADKNRDVNGLIGFYSSESVANFGIAANLLTASLVSAPAPAEALRGLQV